MGYASAYDACIPHRIAVGYSVSYRRRLGSCNIALWGKMQNKLPLIFTCFAGRRTSKLQVNSDVVRHSDTRTETTHDSETSNHGISRQRTDEQRAAAAAEVLISWCSARVADRQTPARIQHCSAAAEAARSSLIVSAVHSHAATDCIAVIGSARRR